MQPTFADAVNAMLMDEGGSTDPEAVGKIDDRFIDVGAGKIAARIYWPLGLGPFPIVVYYHGGGFVLATYGYI